MKDIETVAWIYAVGGALFLVGFFVAVVTTGARTIWYFRHRGEAIIPRATFSGGDVVEMPQLLVRDVIVKGGMFISFGLITLLRFFPQETRIAFTTGNVSWALATTVPAVVAILVYDWFELFVIKRAR